MASAAQIRASEKYDKENTTRRSLKFNTTTDADILERLEQVGNVQGYIKALIRDNISMLGLDMTPEKLVERVGIREAPVKVVAEPKGEWDSVKYVAEFKDGGKAVFTVSIFCGAPYAEIISRTPGVKTAVPLNEKYRF